MESVSYFFNKARKEMPLAVQGSLTLEAAIILPLFTCFIVAALFFFRVVECQLSVEKALDHSARMGASVITEPERSAAVQAAAAASAFARTSSDKNASDYPLWPTMLIAPVADGDDLSLTGSYLLKLPLPLIGTKNLVVSQRVTARKWIGYTGGGGGLDDSEDTVVYVTADSEVYHTSPECSHLKLSIGSISGENLASARNAGGSKYKKCDKCKPAGGMSTYYIAREGDCYHSTMGCSGLKRIYYTKYLSEVQGVLRPCSRCGR